MDSLNRNPTLKTSWRFFEQIYGYVDKTDPGIMLYSSFTAIVKM